MGEIVIQLGQLLEPGTERCMVSRKCRNRITSVRKKGSTSNSWERRYIIEFMKRKLNDHPSIYFLQSNYPYQI